jgi:uncharacterized Fe-S cluster-containing protein
MNNSKNQTPVTKLIIRKNKRVVDRDNHFTYVFDWYSGDQLVYREPRKMNCDELMMPVELYDLDEVLAHKIECCMNIDLKTFIIEEVEV